MTGPQLSDVCACRYDDAPEDLRREIHALVERAYGGDDAPPDGPVPLHDPAMDAWSFWLRRDGRVVAYAGVVTMRVEAAGQRFVAAGLSSVATDPAYRRRGLARVVVAAASRHIERRGVDLGVFTCAPSLVPLYTKAGGWQVAPDMVLRGNSAPDALNSATLGVVVLARLFSARARAAAGTLLHGTIDLGLPPGAFV